MRIAFTRPVPQSLARCELTYLSRTLVDVTLATQQHQRYEEALRTLGCTVRQLPPTDDLPDSVFVEDAATVLDEIAVITRPGAASRRPECVSVAAALSELRPIESIEAPGTMDGGDVLRLGRKLLVGLSTRTNDDGARQLAQHTKPFGYTVECVRTRDCLHLKSAVTALGDGTVLCNPDWIDPRVLGRVNIIEVDRDEPHAANVLRLGHTLVCASAHPRTVADLRSRGYSICTVDVSELAKAEAGVTCCSLIVE